MKSFVLAGLLLVAASCQDSEDASSTQAVAQFTKSSITFSENDGQQQVILNLNIPAASNGEIILSTSALNTSCVVTEPAAESGQIKLPVAKGQALISFSITPVDNNIIDGCKVIKFSITSVSPGLRKGSTRDIIVSVNDDEGPVSADFETASMNIREDSPGGGLINISIASAAPADGVLVFGFDTQSKYGVDFITGPPAVSGKVFLQVAKGATSAAVRIIPINNSVFTIDRSINFHLVDATGGLSVGRNDAFWCTITEDDGKMILPIAGIRSLQSPEDVKIRDSYIEGIVTSISNVSGDRIVVEDATGALQIQLQTGHHLTRGDVVLLNLDEGSLHLEEGVLEVKDVVQFEKLGQETLRINKYNLEEVTRSVNRIQSKTIQVSGVTFTQADGSITFLGDRTISDGTRDIVVRTISDADFGDQTIPSGPITITGIFVEVNGESYLYPQEITDIRSGHTSIIKRD